MADQTRRADLVLEGGGVKAVGLLGAIVRLAERGYRFPRVAGSSAGAIVAALVAAYQQAGRSVTDLPVAMRRLDYRKCREETTLDRLGAPGKALELLLSEGIYRGDYLAGWLGSELAAVDVRTFGDLRIDDDADTSLPQRKRYRLMVTASDVTRGEQVRLPWDYHYYGLDPDRQLIADAVRASTAIPFFFRPVKLATGDARSAGGGPVTLVDGGLLANFAVDAFDRTDGQPPRWPTIGVKLSATPALHRPAHPAYSTVGLAIACLRTLIDEHDAYHLADERITSRTIFVDTTGVSATDFDIDEAAKAKLYDAGSLAADHFLAAGGRTAP